MTQWHEIAIGVALGGAGAALLFVAILIIAFLAWMNSGSH